MTTKEYLQQIFSIDENINLLKSEISVIKDTLYYDGMTQEQEKIYNEKKTVIDAEITRLANIKFEIIDAISKVKNTRQRDVLFRRYVEKRKWEDVALIIDCDGRNIYRTHNIALANIDLPLNVMDEV